MDHQAITVYCLPFAGGNQHSYRKLAELPSQLVNLVPVELPGKGHRIKEALLTDVNAMADDVFEQIRYDLSKPYAIYGHSMGSLIGYLLTIKIMCHRLPPPIHLFFSGAHEPSRLPVLTPRHLFSKEDFKKKLKELGGSPDEVLENQMLFDFYEPLLRADFQATDTYIHEPSGLLNVPVTVMIGKDEGITMEQALSWQNETTGGVEVIYFPGGHFFIFDFEKEIMDIIESKLKAVHI